jgi:hypothetical protein
VGFGDVVACARTGPESNKTGTDIEQARTSAAEKRGRRRRDDIMVLASKVAGATLADSRDAKVVLVVLCVCRQVSAAARGASATRRNSNQ